MAIQRTDTGWVSDGHVVVTGPARGAVTLEDGTTYDVSADVIEVESPDHAEEVADLIGRKFEAEGHPDHAKIHPPDHPEYVPFRHTPSGRFAEEG